MRYFRLIILITMPWLFPSQSAAVSFAQSDPVTTGINSNNLEKILVYFLNKDRTINGLPPLAPNGALTLVARHHSKKMLKENTLNHEFPNYLALNERIQSAGLFYTTCAENIAQGKDCTMKVIHDSLMNSPKHRQNILSPNYKQLGIGIVEDRDHIFVTQVFATLYTPMESTRMEEELRRGIAQNSRLRPYIPTLNSQKRTEICRKLAQRLISGSHPDELLAEHPNAFITLIRFSDIDVYIIFTLIRAITPSQHLHWELGVAYDQSDQYPNGIYALALYVGKE